MLAVITVTVIEVVILVISWATKVGENGARCESTGPCP